MDDIVRKICNVGKVVAAFILSVLVLAVISALCGCKSSKGAVVDAVHTEHTTVTLRDSVNTAKTVERMDSVISLVIVERKDCVVICIDTIGRVIHRWEWHDVGRSNDVSRVRNVTANDIVNSFAYFDSVAVRKDSVVSVLPVQVERKPTAWDTVWRRLSDAATAVVVSLIVVAVAYIIYIRRKTP